MVTGLDKALVSLVMAILAFVNIAFGFQFTGLTEDQISGFIFALWPILVYFVPNKKPTA